MGSIYLHDIVCPAPSFEKDQADSFLWLQKAYRHYQDSHTASEEDYERLLKRVGVKPSQISKRGYFLPDFHLQAKDCEVFTADKVAGVSTRQKKFLSITHKIIQDIYQQRELPRHLIHVTCTGYVSPSAAQIIAAEKSPDTVVTHSYHMGCYGAFPALRMAQGFIFSDKNAAVDIVHTELCTLHLNPVDPSLEQMLVQTLFSDGVAVYRLSQDKPAEMGFELLHLTEFLIPNSGEAMSWDISENGFRMSLSKEIPDLIVSHLRQAIEKWEKQSGIFIRGLLRDAIVAVHPGGPKIIEFVARSLELHEDQVRFSKKVLFEHGNMSSATVPHIWLEILKDPSVTNGTPVVSMAFGPGLTLSMSLMQVVR